jgi:hypothetical protein
MSQAQPCIEYDPSCVECRRDAGKDAAGTTWQCVGHVYLERDRLRTALATAQAERSEALLECNCAVLERDAALQRAEQAEAALAQAQAKRDSLIKRLDFWIECNNGERANGRMPTFLNPYTILLWIGDKRVAAEADVAQPPALPPLPEGWVREGVRDIILYRSHDRYTGVDGHVPPGGQVSVHAEGLRVSTTHVPVADLLIVLRHAEAAHQQLKEGK